MKTGFFQISKISSQIELESHQYLDSSNSLFKYLERNPLAQQQKIPNGETHHIIILPDFFNKPAVQSFALPVTPLWRSIALPKLSIIYPNPYMFSPRIRDRTISLQPSNQLHADSGQEPGEPFSKFDPQLYAHWLKKQKYSISNIFVNSSIISSIRDFNKLVQRRLIPLLRDASISWNSYISQIETLHFNLWCHRQLILYNFKIQFYTKYIIPQVKKIIESFIHLKEVISVLDREKSEKIVVREDGTVLTTHGKVQPSNFKSIAGRTIIQTGAENVVSGDQIIFDGSKTFIVGQNVDYMGSDAIVITKNKQAVGDKKILLDRFFIDMNTFEDPRSVNPVFIETDLPQNQAI